MKFRVSQNMLLYKGLQVLKNPRPKKIPKNSKRHRKIQRMRPGSSPNVCQKAKSANAAKDAKSVKTDAKKDPK